MPLRWVLVVTVLWVPSSVGAQLFRGFIGNEGQWPSDVEYVCRAPGVDVWVTATALVFDVRTERRGISGEATAAYAVEIGFADASVEAVGEGVPTVGFYLGADRTRHVAGAPVVASVRLVGTEGRRVRLTCGAEGLALNAESPGALRLLSVPTEILAAGPELHVETGTGAFPISRASETDREGRRVEVVAEAGRLVPTGVPVASRPPVLNRSGGGDGLEYSTFIGGDDEDILFAVAAGRDGLPVVAGLTFSFNLPGTRGTHRRVNVPNAMVVKLSADGSSIEGAGLIGGSDRDRPWDIEVDTQGRIVIAGWTLSDDFATTAGAAQESFGGLRDAFVARFEPDVFTLDYASYVGGSALENGYGVTTDASSRITVVGETVSDDFPVTPGALQEDRVGAPDGFVARLTADGSAFDFATYLGGGDRDEVRDVTCDGQGRLVAVGETHSEDFPTTESALMETFGGGNGDGFLIRLAEDGGSIDLGTYLGTPSGERVYEVVVDASDRPIVAGEAFNGFPVTPGSFSDSPPGLGGFVARLQESGAAFDYSGFIRGTGWDSIESVDVDEQGRVYMAGHSSSADYPTTPGAYSTTYQGRADVVFGRISADGSTLEYSTFIGGPLREWARGVASLGADRIAVAGMTNSPTYPTTPGAYRDTYLGGTDDGFVSVFDLSGFVVAQEVPPTEHAIQIEPNPARDRIRLTLPEADGVAPEIEVVDVLGRVVQRVPASGAASRELDVSGLAPGLYVVRTVGGSERGGGVPFSIVR